MRHVFPILVTAAFLAACGGSSGGGETPSAATPVFTPGSGTYTTVQTVAISTATPGATIYYTADGSTPSTGSTVYGAAVTVATSATLKALATAPGFTTSAVATASYTINLPDFATFCAGIQSDVVALEVECKKSNPDAIAVEGGISCDGMTMDIQAGRIVYDGVHAADCRAAVTSAGCAKMGGEPAACRLALLGQVANGSICYDGSACQDGYCSADAGACPGLCVPYATAGQTCTAGEVCATGLVCEGSTSPRTCRTASNAVGGDCPCGAGLFCDSIATKCAAQKTSGACTPYSWEAECDPRYACTGNPSTCQPLVGPGGACSSTNYVCGRGYHCGPSDTCVADPKVGEVCTTWPPNCIGGYCDSVSLRCVASARGGTCSATPTLAGLTLYDAFVGTALDGNRWQSGSFTRGVSGGAAVLGVDVTNMRARSIRNDQYASLINVPAGSANRVTTLQADVTVPAATAARTGGGLIRAGTRLLYSPPSQRLLFPGAIKDVLNMEVGLLDDGSGLKAFRQFIHCDDASCATYTATGISVLDPPSFADINIGQRGAAATYDTTYTVTLSLDETTRIFLWTIAGGAFGASGVSGTADPAAYLAANADWTGVLLESAGFQGAQIGVRAADLGAGGADARITGRFDNVQVGRNNGAPAAYDDFSGTGTNSGPDDLAPSRWATPGTTRVGPSGGDLLIHHHVSSFASTNTLSQYSANVGLPVGDPATVNTLQADVVFVNYATTGIGGVGSAGLFGRFFNDGSGSRPGDATGDIQAAISVQAITGTASWNISRCTNATCAATAVGSGDFPGPVYGSSGHRLLLKWDPDTKVFIFGVDGDRMMVDPTRSGVGGVTTPVTYVGSAFAPAKTVNGFAYVLTNTLGTHTSLDVRVSDVLTGP